ncbi:transcription antitermination factor NusB [Ethanoligenens harbinense]|uniref:Transcription antitermination protein NusB n=1 Tax=Ethanoligenens harbinense (strain DSM 18485 / JCM 12961 / CGMCC 1.5033 / YUAN-3) TaxID=663278 RepID=E6U5K0_ETHHY|nr:transcription antitermination factor NusB [Ethanoligenens harbinense]ADU26759.1 NusB antitermination factor [Ethanoligenens harbinense YUAN-3]AVQ95866.1 transcription antitermination factor NusB [Ethanoligenens harbinense YUAN-3]AYF38528.1 transcription antitermination factor NusB [Ethanoligenens harbinense]AYF41275.1 transcription antitermination factor NusB [Ethanoligenens harbinense]QCN92107.1 transcription antitermination factor NusB [Ethanoligenens harbinense]
MTRREAREQALCLVFEGLFKEENVSEILDLAVQAREEFLVDTFAEMLATGVYDHRDDIDRKIEQYAIGWTKSRLSRVVLTVLRIAFFELLYEQDTPDSVAINEAVELAKKYGGDGDSAFVNGVLGAFVRAEKADAT